MNPARSRRIASIIGLAIGDAVGTTNEFKSRGSFPPVTDMVGGGVFDLPAGAWTDDTSMALCLAESLVDKGQFDAADQMDRYLRWWHEGYWSSTNSCFDIGITTRDALARYQRTGDAFAGSTDPDAAGNGSVMRLAPVVAWAAERPEDAIAFARESSRTTHAAAECIDGCELLARILLRGFEGGDVTAPVDITGEGWSAALLGVAAMDGAPDEPNHDPTGYVVDTLACARWAVARSTDFRSAVLLAANLGGDADTIAAVTGQIAGARWGMEGIPAEWVERLARRDEIMHLVEELIP